MFCLPATDAVKNWPELDSSQFRASIHANVLGRPTDAQLAGAHRQAVSVGRDM